jgi:DNA-binding NarL/FixJ family response regulator
MNKIRVLIVDDQESVRQSLGTVLRLVADLDVVGEAAGGAEAVELAAVLQPDVLVMDMMMAGTDGLAATRAIKRRHRNIRVVLLTMHGSQSMGRRADRAGVDAFVEKGISMESLVQTIREVAKGARA